MDAVTGYMLTGALAGLGGGLTNLLLWRRTLLHVRILGIPVHKGFAHAVSGVLSEIPENFDTKNVKHLEKEILHLFDSFMSEKLTQKMPVLSMFIDDKLIAEIREIFRHEMELHLPALLMRNITAEKNIITIGMLVSKAVRKGLQKYIWHGVAYLALGAVAGGCIGYGVSLL